jgi:hypothetical protein
MCSLFFPSRLVRKADKNAITAVDSQAADAKKEPKPYSN